MKFSFGVNSLDKYWKITKSKVLEYENNVLNEQKAIECAEHLWHMCDWFFKKYESKLPYHSLCDMKGEYGKECKVLRVMRDICNSYKHSGLDSERNPIIKETKKHEGAFSQEFSREFDISHLEVVYNDGSKVYFEDAVQKVIEFWENKIKTNS